MQDKVNIAAVKEKVSNAATKGREAFKSLIHKAKHSPEVYLLFELFAEFVGK